MEITNAKDFLKQTVKVKIDRPLGSKHPKHDFKYDVNYGFVPDTVSGDGEELDCYILGVNEPLEEFEGKCVAIIHRIDDNDDKLVIIPEEMDGANFTDDVIRRETNFQEKWFKSEIIRKEEISCGCIIINDNKVFLIQQTKGHWGFPKGHIEDGETEIETAKRETKEETNLNVKIDERKRIEDVYLTDKGVIKKVVFFIAEKIDGTEKMQEDEIKSMGWFNFDEAFRIITYENTKEILKKAIGDV